MIPRALLSLRVGFRCRAVVEQIFGRAKGYAEVASRAKPVPEDVLLACEEYDLDFKELRKESRKRRRNRKNSQYIRCSPSSLLFALIIIEVVRASRLEAPSFRSDSPELLDSDDEKSRHSAPHTIRSLHPHLPPLPPKHTYLRTPVYFSPTQSPNFFLNFIEGADNQEASHTVIREETGKRSTSSNFAQTLAYSDRRRRRQERRRPVRRRGELGIDETAAQEVEGLSLYPRCMSAVDCTNEPSANKSSLCTFESRAFDVYLMARVRRFPLALRYRCLHPHQLQFETMSKGRRPAP